MAPRCKYITTLYIFVVTATTGCGGAEFSVFDRAATDGGAQQVVDAPDSTPGDGGTVVSAGGSMGTGGVSTVSDSGTGASGGVGGATSTGGTVNESGGAGGAGGTGGASGGAGGRETGGVTSTGGAPATGGVTGCVKVTHSNGLGQTWEDCVAASTFDESQATKACKASGATQCITFGSCAFMMCGFSTGAGATCFGCWGYGGPFAGKVSPAATCGCPQDPGPTWE